MTTTPLPPDAIQRVLFLTSTVHIYNIPPQPSNKGHLASAWTSPDTPTRQIFTARLRILETAVPLPSPSPSPNNINNDDNDPDKDSLIVEILLEDPSTGELFAKAPYTDAGAVEAALDSSRFFAVRVVGDGGMKATLGIGFEDRGEAIDFGICLQECRRVLGVETGAERKMGAVMGPKTTRKKEAEGKRDYGLKEGETIVVDIGRKGRRKAGDEGGGAGGAVDALFSIKPPPGVEGKGGAGAIPVLAPPPRAQDVRAEKRRSRGFGSGGKTAAELGFDDGEFGEFQ